MEQLITPSILQTIIICSTIIIAGTVGVSWYRVYKGEKSSYIFSSSVLTILAITVFSYSFYENRGVLDFISLASALISIVLAVVTIIYSFYSNSRSAGQIETLNNAAKSVEQATSSYSKTADSLQKNIEKIIASVVRVEENTKILLGMNNAGSSEQNSKQVNATINNEGQTTNNAEFDLVQYIRRFIQSASPIGIVAMYACILSKDKTKPLNLNQFRDTYTQIYCHGYLISIASSGFIALNIDNSGDIKVSAYVPFVKDLINTWLSTADLSLYIGLQDWKNSIDEYFGV